jgi:hypothetical protein
MKLCLYFVTACIALIGFASASPNAAPTASAATRMEPPPLQSPRLAHPHEKYSLAWVDNDAPSIMTAGSTSKVQVRAKNTGDWVWPDAQSANPSKPDGSYAVRLSYAWVGPDGKPLPENRVRGELPASVPAGQTADFTISVEAPKEPGNYLLQFDLVEELVTFFSAKGAEKLTIKVTIR